MGCISDWSFVALAAAAPGVAGLRRYVDWDDWERDYLRLHTEPHACADRSPQAAECCFKGVRGANETCVRVRAEAQATDCMLQNLKQSFSKLQQIFNSDIHT